MDELEKGGKKRPDSGEDGAATALLREQYSQDLGVRIFSPEEAVSIISEAEAVQELRHKQFGEDRLSALLSGQESRDGLPISRVYELAEALNVERQAIDEVLTTRYPTIEQQVKDLKRFNAKLSVGHLADIYLSNIVPVLRRAFPLDEILLTPPHWASTLHSPDRILSKQTKKTVLKRGWFGREKKIVKEEKTELARIMFCDANPGGFHAFITCYEPVFLRVTGDCLENLQVRLKEFFEGLHNEVAVSYNPLVNVRVEE